MGGDSSSDGIDPAPRSQAPAMGGDNSIDEAQIVPRSLGKLLKEL